MSAPPGLMAALQKKQQGGGPAAAGGGNNDFLAHIGKKAAAGGGGPPKLPTPPPPKKRVDNATIHAEKVPDGKLFHFDADTSCFFFDLTKDGAKFVQDCHGNDDTDILIPLAPCIYRLADYTYAKKEPVELRRCIIQLGVLRCLARECKNLNHLLWHRLNPSSNGKNKIPGFVNLDSDEEIANIDDGPTGAGGAIEEDELGKARFMELLSKCGVYQKVSEMILQRAGKVSDSVVDKKQAGNEKNPYLVPQIHVDGLDDFLQALEDAEPGLAQARKEIEETQSVSFYPGLGELFTPGSKLLCHPDGMEGIPVGCSCVQSWYAEELNKATNKVKRRFILVIEFIVSVGDELVFVAASEVYPEFHDTSRNAPIKDLTHRKLIAETSRDDAELLQRLQKRGEFYASVATKNHFLEYMPNSFFPIIGGGWSSNAVRPLSKGGRVMVDVKRGILENHIPIRGTADGMSDTVKEAIKLFDTSKRTGVAVPFRTCILPGFDGVPKEKKVNVLQQSQEQGDSDRAQLWQSWPMLTGFSFTARVWGKLLLTLPKAMAPVAADSTRRSGSAPATESPRRASVVKMGVAFGGLGGVGSSGSCGYINFQEQAFEQLVLAEDKKELIRAVARNAGGGAKFDDEYDDSDDEDDMGLDVVANKGAASIFLLHGPPGCGKTLTAEAIAELLKKPLYVVTAGDLGITAAEVEKTLGSVLELCQTWDALVLIDEADIFLEARNSTEIQRNALVCVMLRLLEYYSGCLFLSSNRAADSIDPAIASRITVMLGYPPLDAVGRAKVWKNLIELVPTLPIDESTGKVYDKILSNPRKSSKYRVEFTSDEYEQLASSYLLNGRQIKNSIVLARALARERGMALSLSILQRAVTAVAGENATVPV